MIKSEKELLALNKLAKSYSEFISKIVFSIHNFGEQSFQTHRYNLFGFLARLNLAFLRAASKEFNLDIPIPDDLVDTYYDEGSWKYVDTERRILDDVDIDDYSVWDFENSYQTYIIGMYNVFTAFSPFATYREYELYAGDDIYDEYMSVEHDGQEETEELDEEKYKDFAYWSLTEGFFSDGFSEKNLIMENIDYCGDGYYVVASGKNILIPFFRKWYNKQKSPSKFARKIYSIIEDEIISPLVLTLYNEDFISAADDAYYIGGIVGTDESSYDYLGRENLNPAYILQQIMICDSILLLNERYHFIPDTSNLFLPESNFMLMKEMEKQKHSRSDSLYVELAK